MKNKIYAGVIFVLSVVFSTVLSTGFFLYKDFFSHTTSLGLIGIFLVNFVSNASFFFSGPAFLTVIAGGDIYPPILVALAASLGAALGDMISFLFGFSGRNLTKQRLEKSKLLRFLEANFQKHGGIIVFLMALIPNPLFDAIGILAGIFNYPPMRFFIIMLVGRFLRYLLLAQISSKL